MRDSPRNMSEGRRVQLRSRAHIRNPEDQEISVANYLLSRLEQLGVTVSSPHDRPTLIDS
jgi:hypothetical protein